MGYKVTWQNFRVAPLHAESYGTIRRCRHRSMT